MGRSPWFEGLWWYLFRFVVWCLPLCGYFDGSTFYPFDELNGKWMPPVPAQVVFDLGVPVVEVPGPSPFDPD